MKRRVRIDLAYDGTAFAGWQLQPDQRTVQGVLERKLTGLQGGERVVVNGASRTDSGVHARAQVADCELEVRLDDKDLAHALRCLLPHDVRALRVRSVNGSFHSRKHALAKTYHYVLDRTRHGDPFRARFALHCPYDLDLDRIASALRLLPGRRDWTCFTSSSCDKEDRVRNLTEARLESTPDEGARFTFSADGFLRYMVRNLVGTLLEIGRHRMPLERLERVLSSNDRSLAGPTAPPQGLFLDRIAYPVDPDD